jgi:hypothetical protein
LRRRRVSPANGWSPSPDAPAKVETPSVALAVDRAREAVGRRAGGERVFELARSVDRAAVVLAAVVLAAADHAMTGAVP